MRKIIIWPMSKNKYLANKKPNFIYPMSIKQFIANEHQAVS
jgi:hypothetical protein